MDEIVVATSTKIEDILEYVDKNIPIQSLYNYEIVCFDGNHTPFNNIELRENAYELFSVRLFEKENYKNEYKHVCNCLSVWCENLKEETRKIKEEQELRRKEKREQEERLLYEKLKAKYGE